jgi:Leucine-rich repeat (LRR) protein
MNCFILKNFFASRYCLIFWLLSALQAESATIYVDNVNLKQNESLAKMERSEIPDGRSEISVIFQNSTIHTISEKVFGNSIKADRIVVSGCQIQQIVFKSTIKTLKDLDLSSNQISRLSSNQFKWAKKLIKLNLSQNSIAEMEESAFADLYKLTELDLSGNQLKTLTVGVFEKLFVLKTVNLERNSLKRISNFTFKGSNRLINICLSDNDIFGVDTHAFYNLNLLKNLQMNDNQLTTFDGIVLPQDINRLSLDDNHLKLVKFDDYLQLKHLSLAKNEEIVWRPSMFENLFELVDLSLSETNLPGSLISEGLLKHAENLLSLDLSRNPLGVLDIATMPVMNNLTHLNLEECQLTVLENIEEIELKFPRLAELNIMTNYWDCKPVVQLISFLKTVTVIGEEACKRTTPSDEISYLREAGIEVTDSSTIQINPASTIDTTSIDDITSTIVSDFYLSDDDYPATVPSKIANNDSDSEMISSTEPVIHGDNEYDFLDHLVLVAIGVVLFLHISIGIMIYCYFKCRKTQVYLSKEIYLEEL